MKENPVQNFKIALMVQGGRNYERGLLRGISEYANVHGPWHFFRELPYMPVEKKPLVQLISEWEPDAMIIRESENTSSLLEIDVP
ncbi:MAG: hypothetical protein HQL32_13525, partial [Planctomycetes bacterium]|nr:hypothetical protein [Planctomycetota bacterium]